MNKRSIRSTPKNTPSRSPSPKKRTDKRPYIGEVSESEPWYQEFNKGLERGQRINYTTDELAWRSLFELHNETCNVWSHMLGAGLFVLFIAYIFVYLEHPALSLVYRPDACSIDTQVVDAALWHRQTESEPHWFHSYLNQAAFTLEHLDQTV